MKPVNNMADKPTVRSNNPEGSGVETVAIVRVYFAPSKPNKENVPGENVGVFSGPEYSCAPLSAASNVEPDEKAQNAPPNAPL